MLLVDPLLFKEKDKHATHKEAQPEVIPQEPQPPYSQPVGLEAAAFPKPLAAMSTSCTSIETL